MGRIAFRADERLEQRLRDLTEALKKHSALRHIEVTTSTAIKVALGLGLPFAELDYKSDSFGDGEEKLESWLNSVYAWVTEWADQLDIELDPKAPRPNPELGDPGED